jgi:hypothetical protein
MNPCSASIFREGKHIIWHAPYIKQFCHLSDSLICCEDNTRALSGKGTLDLNPAQPMIPARPPWNTSVECSGDVAKCEFVSRVATVMCRILVLWLYFIQHCVYVVLYEPEQIHLSFGGKVPI